MTRAVFADEVVTHAIGRDVALPGGAGTLVLITLDNGLDHTKPTTLGPAGLRELDDTVAAVLARDDVAAVAVTGKPYFFCVGADLKGVGQVRDAAQAREMAELGHAVFSRLRTAAVPTFAFVNGAAMGGGTELALSCGYRSISTGVSALALPETFLGLVPGWGGATLLPRLVGIETAVQMIIVNPLDSNRMLRGLEAYELGLADAIFEPADFLEQSIRWAAGVVRGAVTVQRAEPSLDESVWQAAITRGRAIAEAKVHGAAPAPYRALDILETARTSRIEDGFAAEEDALTELIMSEEFRASVYAFDLVQRRAKRPAGAPDRSLARPVTKVGIVGAGLMASQLALLFARRLLVPVVLTDLDQDRVDRGLSYVRAEIDKLQGKDRVAPDLANRLRRLVSGSVDRSVFGDADFVIEAVFEDLDVKKQVFAELESVVRPDCVLATNTSSLSISELAADLVHPERVVGFHFFNPVAVLPLLEVVRAERTDDASLATAFDVGGSLRKSCVLVADAPAFVVNRLLTRFLGEIMAAVDTGTPIGVADRAMAPLGLPMPPFELLGLVGPAVALHVAETLSAAFPDRFAVSPGLRRLVDAGKSAVWVRTSDGGAELDAGAAALLVGAGDGLDAAEILDRALRALAQEARLLLDEGVVAGPQDIDLCLLLGAGWPFHLGGLTPYLDRTGVSEAVTGRRFLPPGVASLPEPSTESGDAADQPADPAAPGAAATSAAAAGAHLPQQVGTAPDEPDQLFSDEALVVTSGELTPRGMTLRLAMGGEVRVAFAMPLPVAQIGMFAGRPLPVPASMFTAVLVTGGAEATIGVTSVTVLSAGDGEAQLELNGTLDFGSAGLPYPDRQVTLTPTVTVAA